MGRLAKPSDSPFENIDITSDTQRADKIVALLKDVSTLDDFMTIGSDLNNTKLGQRYVKFSAEVVIGALKGKYWGEWS
jgi:hypothetical protein